MVHVNAKLDFIAQHHWWPARTANDRKYRMFAFSSTLKIIDALECLGPYRNFQWRRDTELQEGFTPWRPPIVVSALDIPIVLHPTMIGVPPPPMGFAAHRAHYLNLPKEPRRETGTIPARPTELIMWSPSPNEVMASDQERWRDWFEDLYDDGGGPYPGFPRTEVFAIGNNRSPMTAYACAGDGNCYWYAIA